MNAIDIKSKLQYYIEQADPSFLQIVQVMFEQYFKEEKKWQIDREKELLTLIDMELSDAKKERVDELDTKRSLQLLTPEEHAELIELVYEVEAFNAQRMQYLSELAKLRKIHIRTMMKNLNIKPRISV